MNLISPVLNGLKEDDDLMALSKLFQLFMQNEKKLFAYLPILEKGGPVAFLREEVGSSVW